MKINVTTDFNIGDTIHYMKDNKPTFGIVKCINVQCTSEKEIKVMYTVGVVDFVSESNAFANPYDLRDALFQVEEKK